MDKGNGCCFSLMTMPSLIVILITIFIIFIVRGHTAEMINLIRVLQWDRFTPRVYVAASTDNMSLQKAQVLEASMVDQADPDKLKVTVQFMQIYRSEK
ncbi:hypothetical protein MKW92_032469 [Papaver armeniacum]|nr:hypothetical protein MKW92_032469 [Papaver armeniacum]